MSESPTQLHARPKQPTGAPRTACLGASVGDDADPAAENRLDDRAALVRRLRWLGYATTDSVAVEHSTRLLLCAAAGLSVLEDTCDGAGPTCTVRDQQCPGRRHRPWRGTCLRDHACARGLIERDSPEHTLLRAPNAPRWVRLPAAGCGTVVAQAPRQLWGTDWLATALVHAGRLYAQAAQGATRPPINVSAGSAREGGSTSAHGKTSQYQAGLAVEVIAPAPGVPAVEADAQLDALAKAGFRLYDGRCTTDPCALLDTRASWTGLASVRAVLDAQPIASTPLPALDAAACGSDGGGSEAPEPADLADVLGDTAAELHHFARSVKLVLGALEEAWYGGNSSLLRPRLSQARERMAAHRSPLPCAHSTARPDSPPCDLTP